MSLLNAATRVISGLAQRGASGPLRSTVVCRNGIVSSAATLSSQDSGYGRGQVVASASRSFHTSLSHDFAAQAVPDIVADDLDPRNWGYRVAEVGSMGSSLGDEDYDQFSLHNMAVGIPHTSLQEPQVLPFVQSEVALRHAPYYDEEYASPIVGTTDDDIDLEDSQQESGECQDGPLITDDVDL